MYDSDDDDDYYPDGDIENGHLQVDLPSNGSPSNLASDEQQESDPFDVDLPATHRYLGRLDNVTGYTFYDHGEEVTLPALQTNTLVFPGYNLPLVLNNGMEIDTLQTLTMHKNVFVLLTPSKDFNSIFPWGVVMEIFETHLRTDVLHLKACSRQRCKLVKGQNIKRLVGGLYEVKVKVMLDQAYESPISNTQLNSLKHCRKFICDNESKVGDLFRYRKYHLSQYPLPSFVYDSHEVYFLADCLIKGLQECYTQISIPADPVQLSYWFVQTYLLQHSERLRIMEIGNVVERLRLELRYLKMKRTICCLHCESQIADQTDILPMSKDGAQSNYCNPSGNVFETVTVSKASNFTLVGRIPSSQFSWFPGYSWIIMQCRICKNHLGWKFSAINLKPECFYGLAKSGFTIKISFEDDYGQDMILTEERIEEA